MINRERGFGFIRRSGQPDLFFHASAMGETREESKEEFASLSEGDIVEYIEADGLRGLEAKEIKKV